MISFPNITQEDNTLCTSLANINSRTLSTFLLVNFVLFSGCLSIFGVLFNIVNIVVFVKLGFSETTNITLLSLSISDLGVVLIMLAFSILYNPLVVSSASPDLIDAIFYLALGWPKGCLSRISSSLTVIAALERFLCVSLPLKVKKIVTVPRVVIACVSVVVFLVTIMLPVFTGFAIRWRVNPATNVTSFGIIRVSSVSALEDVSLSIVTFTQFSSFTLVFLLTISTVSTLQQRSRWRKATSSAAQNKTITARDKRLVQMIVYVSAVFIVCNLPALAGTITKLLVKDYDLNGRCRNIFIATFSLFFCLGTVNATINMFIYYHLSSRYRDIIKSIFFKHVIPKDVKYIARN